MKNETFYQLEIIAPGDCYGDLYATKSEAYEAAEQTWKPSTASGRRRRTSAERQNTGKN